MADSSDISQRLADPPADEPMGSLQVDQLVGNFRVQRKLGEGGMGEVWAAEHKEIGFRAAIKVLHPEYSLQPEIARRFFNEARAVNIVQHPGIVKIFEFGRLPDKTAYIIMEFLEGEVLADRIRRLGKLPEEEALQIMRQIASILCAAHRSKVVHRDLKPANVILVPDPEGPSGERVKLLDFGLAKVVADMDGGDSGSNTRLRTRTGVVMGTALYMAPEQCRGAAAINGMADVYALGVMTYEALCGRPPFTAKSEGELVSMHLRDQPPPLRRFAPEVSHEAAKLVHHMLRKLPEERPTMTQVMEELTVLQEPVPGRRSLVKATMSIPRLTWRRRARWAGLFAGVCAGALLGAVGMWTQQRFFGMDREQVAWQAVESGTRYHLRVVYGWPGDLWAAGDNGTSLHWNGVRWTAVPTPTTESLRGLWGAERDALYAVGSHGTMLRWNGLAWTEQSNVVTVDLRGIWGAGQRDIWAVGKQGTVLHGDGAGWSEVPSGVKQDLRSVWGSGPGDVWAVGEYGVILRWDGVSWTQVSGVAPNWLQRVWGTGPNDVWAVGNESTVLHWDGKRWEQRDYANRTKELSAMWGDDRGRAWIGGSDGAIIRWSGGRLERMPSGTRNWIYGMWGSAEAAGAPGAAGRAQAGLPGLIDIWAVGADGAILRYQP